MTIFWTLAAGLAALALLFLVPPLLRTNAVAAEQAPDQDSLNLEVFRQRLAELDGDLAAGNLDQTQYDAAKSDLERELLYDLDRDGGGATVAPQAAPVATAARAPLLALALAVLVPATAVLAYLQIGEQEIIPRIEMVAQGGDPSGLPAGHGGNAETPSLDQLTARLAEKLEQNPDNLEGWVMLARTYFATNQPTKALGAMERAYELAPREANVVIGYAEAIAANQDNQLAGRPAELIRTALELEPTNPSARWLDGMLAYQQERFDEAASTWESILGEMDPAGEEAAQMRQMVAEARERAGDATMADQPGAASGPPASTPQPATAEEPASPAVTQAPAPSKAAAPAPAPAPPVPAAPATQGASIQVSADLAPGLADRVAPGDTVFVFARAAAGPPMPLAVQRFRVADLPVSVTLDDSMAMMPAMRLSAFPEVIVGARVSRAGQAMPQPGDLEGQVGPVAVGAAGAVSVTIDRVRP